MRSMRRVVAWFAPAALLGLLVLAGCGGNAGNNHPLTAAEILQRATNVFDFSGATHSNSSAAVQDLTFTMTMNVDMKMSSSSLGNQDIMETANATGKETLKPRRSEISMTMGIEGENFTTDAIVDYASATSYIKLSGFSALPGSSPNTWYKISLGSLGAFNADTSMYMDYSKLKGAKLIGSETINGVAVWHLRANEDVNQSMPGAASGSTSANGKTNLTMTVDYYFRQDNYRPVKVVLTGNDTLSGLGTMKMNTEMDFISFNTGVTIALPPASDVQAFPDMS